MNTQKNGLTTQNCVSNFFDVVSKIFWCLKTQKMGFSFQKGHLAHTYYTNINGKSRVFFYFFSKVQYWSLITPYSRTSPNVAERYKIKKFRKKHLFAYFILT